MTMGNDDLHGWASNDPKLAGPPRRAGAAPVVIAHRGASADAPENTLPAFRAAWSAGIAWVETDVQPSADGVPVLLHDDTVDRTTDGAGPLRSLTAACLGGLDAGAWFPGGAFHGTPVPTLAETLTVGHAVAGPPGGARLLLEVKGDHTAEQLATVLGVLAEADADRWVYLQSFEVNVLRRLRQLAPHRPLGLLVEELDDDPVNRCRELGATSYNPEHVLLRERPELVPELRAADIGVSVWTADEPADWAYLSGLGVDGIITNRPAALTAWLAAR